MSLKELEDHQILLTNCVTDHEVKAYYRRLSMDDLEILTAIEMENQALTGSKDMCVDVTREEFRRYLMPGRGIYFGVFVDAKIIAMYCMVRPVPEENLGVHLPLEGEALNHVVHWELAHVLPEYRGNGLQKFLSEKCMEVFYQEWKDVKHIFATIFPHNLASLKSTMKYKFVIVHLNELYGGYLRYVLYKPVEGEFAYDETGFTVDLDDWETQLKYMADGYVGTAFIERKDGNYIRFNRKKLPLG